jgi:hypothetical protein
MARVIRFIALVGAVGAVAAPAAGAGNGHGIVVSFDKRVVDPTALVFAGTTDGAAKGALQSRFVPGSLTVEGDVWRLSFDWIVSADASAKSFVARTTGTLDTRTGRVIMDGTVTSGWHAGANVHEEGQLVDPATFEFAGTIAIHPDGSEG